MPQEGRKVAFSGKKKKLQLLKKRQLKNQGVLKTIRKADESDENEETSSTASTTQKINFQNLGRVNSNRRRYALQFHKESKKELELMKQESRNTIVRVSIEDLQIDGRFFHNYDFPIRPPWSYEMSREELDRNENRYFTDYVQKLEKQHSEENKLLSLFELNLETWRQFWRVLEMSDILLLIVDIRFSALMFPPSLYKHITEKLQKNVILILNKVDLVPADVVIAWKQYFIETYPGITVVVFSSYPCRSSPTEEQSLKLKKRRTARKISAFGAQSIFKECQKIVGKAIELSKWEQKILEEMEQSSNVLDDEDEETQNSGDCPTHEEIYDFNFEEREKYKDGILTIGCLGFPNVGKSSIINALKGRKIVSVSRTPGHTKHFQTIFLTDNVKLCDCPGLVFPSSTPKNLQVLIGSYPVAQLREPYFSIKFLAERIDLPKILNIKLPDDLTDWSAIAICESWAEKKGFITAKAARPDCYRAANNILRLALEGKIILAFYPPDFLKNREMFAQHEEIEEIKKVQLMEKFEPEHVDEQNISSSEIPSDSYDENSEKDDSSDSSTEAKTNQNVFAVLDEE